MTWQHPLIVLGGPLLAGYLIGSTPFGVIIARSKGVDLRKVGSGNVGATNVARTLGRRWGYLCFVLDVAKGFLPVFVVGLLIGGRHGPPPPLHQAAWLSAGFGAIAGHVFSFWLKFRGGKGAAASLGVVLGVYPYFTWPGLCALGIWLAVTLTTRYVSLGSIAAAAAFLPLLVAFQWRQARELWPLLTFAAVVAALIIVRHRGNVSRLVAGKEHKIGRSGRGG